MAFALLKPSRHDVYPFIDPRQGLKGAAAGKVVLITGAGARGIGGVIAQSFALAGAASVILVGRRKEPLEENREIIAKLAAECQVLIKDNADISDRKAVEALFGSLPAIPDVVVSNAATNETVNIADSDPDTWWRTMEVNVNGPYLVARTYIRALKAAGKTGARLINISSNSSWSAVPGFSAYGASKIALNSLSEYIDKEEALPGGSGLRCVAVHPGGVITEMADRTKIPEQWRSLMNDTPALAGGTSVYLSTNRATFLMGRFVSSTWDMEDLGKVEKRVVDEDLLRSRVLGVHR